MITLTIKKEIEIRKIVYLESIFGLDPRGNNGIKTRCGEIRPPHLTTRQKWTRGQPFDTTTKRSTERSRRSLSATPRSGVASQLGRCGPH